MGFFHIIFGIIYQPDTLEFRPSLDPTYGKVYSIQHNVINFVSDLRQVGGFLRFPSPIKLTTII